MDERIQFVARRLAGEPMAELCRLRFTDFLDQWLRDDVSRLEPTPERIYRCGVAKIKPALGAIPIGAVSTQSIEGFLGQLQRQKLSAATVHQVFRVLRTALRDAVRCGILPESPCRFASPPSAGERDATIWDEEQLRLFLAKAKRVSKYHVPYLTIVLTGLRKERRSGCGGATSISRPA